jgi:hypothetical protein
MDGPWPKTADFSRRVAPQLTVYVNAYVTPAAAESEVGKSPGVGKNPEVRKSPEVGRVGLSTISAVRSTKICDECRQHGGEILIQP